MTPVEAVLADQLAEGLQQPTGMRTNPLRAIGDTGMDAAPPPRRRAGRSAAAGGGVLVAEAEEQVLNDVRPGDVFGALHREAHRRQGPVPADLADILEDLGRVERREIVSALDPETAAKAKDKEAEGA